MKRTKLTGKFLLLLIGVALIDVAATVAYFNHASRAMDEPRLPVEGAATAVVFYSGSGDDTLGRVQTAVELMNRGLANYLVFVGGWRPESAELGSRWMAESARRQGVAAEQSAYDEGSYDSFSNLEAACAVFAENGWNPKDVVLVSDALHLYRLYPWREKIVCVNADSIGYFAAPFEGGLIVKWTRVHRDWLARVALWTLGENRYREMLASVRL